MRTRVAVIFSLFAAALRAQYACPCDPHDPDTLKERVCSLCAVVEHAPPDTPVVFVKDTSLRKPDRWLALPRTHSPGMHQMSALTDAQRIELWTAAIGKAKELWG